METEILTDSFLIFIGLAAIAALNPTKNLTASSCDKFFNKTQNSPKLCVAYEFM